MARLSNESAPAAVRCRAGARYPERPLAFTWQGEWLEVTEVSREERTPAGLVFYVFAADGHPYRLAWDEGKDTWQVQAGKGMRR